MAAGTCGAQAAAMIQAAATNDLAARGESLAAFDGRCIPAGCVAPRSNTPGILGRRALPAGRLARLGATPDFHHGLSVKLRLKPTRKRAKETRPGSLRRSFTDDVGTDAIIGGPSNEDHHRSSVQGGTDDAPQR